MASNRASVAILGATGHIAKALAASLADRYALALYARRVDVARAFAESLGGAMPVEVHDLSDLRSHEHSALINCIGVGDPAAVTDPGIFQCVARYADDVALGYLQHHPGSRLVNISSGAVYHSDFTAPAPVDTLSEAFPRPHDSYGAAKLSSEERHRAMAEAAIVDLRVFGFFSRHIDVNSTYLMADIIRALLARRTLVTGPDDIVRDYIAPTDLAMLVAACLSGEPLNASLDAYSVAPVAKFEILETFAEEFGLTFSVVQADGDARRSVGRPTYYSLDRRASALGWEPTKTSLDVLREETSAILNTIG